MHRFFFIVIGLIASFVGIANPIRSDIASVSVSQEESILPYDAEVEYLEFPKYNTQRSLAFIDTDIVPSLPCNISGHISYARSIQIQCGVGCGWGDNYTAFYPLVTYYNPSRLAAYFPCGIIFFEEYSASGVDAVFSTSLDADGNGYAEINGIVTNISDAFRGRTLTETILIGGGGHIKSDGMPMYTISWGSRVFWVYVKCGDEELDLIPVRFTNKMGISEGAMYDRISGELFRNQGYGDFIIGPDL